MSSAWFGQFWSVKLFYMHLIYVVFEQLPEACYLVLLTFVISEPSSEDKLFAILIFKAMFNWSLFMKWNTTGIWAGSVIFVILS